MSNADLVVSDADLLDIVRRLRTYMSTMDNCHLTILQAKNVDNEIGQMVDETIESVRCAAGEISNILKVIESTKQYKEMVKKYTIK
jgi:hypothetical protein